MNVYPLVFEPIFKPRIWGGRKLESLLAKNLPGDDKIGESWELADLEDDQSVVARGPSAGRTLGEIAREWGKKLLGRAALFEGRFPLLIKFLDAKEKLSVQVHPDQAMANRVGGRVRIKNEAWYIIQAEDDGVIYRGLRDGVDAAELERAIAEGSVESVLNRITVRKGHCYYLPSGTIHALGGGVVVAEVQTPSDTTYRVYDWDRTDASTERPRDLHVQDALQCISYASATAEAEHPEHVASLWTAVTRLVRCESFVIERVRMVEGVSQSIPYDEMVIWVVLEGRGSIDYRGGGSPLTFGVGDTVLLPAALTDGRVNTHADCMWLEVTIPSPSDLSEFERPSRDELREPLVSAGGFVPINLPKTGTAAQEGRE